MMARRSYADPIAYSLGLGDAPIMTTRSLRSCQVGVSRLSVGPQQMGMSPRVPPEDTFIAAMYLTELRYHELWSHGRPFLKQGYAAHSMRIVNLVGEFSAYIASPHETLVFYIPRAALDEFSDDAGGPRIPTLACPPGLVDPVVRHLGATLLPAFERPTEASALFVDHVVLAICAHLAHEHGGFRPYSADVKGGLTMRQAARAKEFMAAHCDETIALADVAQECGLSRGHFIKAFRMTIGLTPHQWRQHYRIDKAQAMLLETADDIAEIAVACGFADQSHLTRVFTALVGDSPAHWRRGRRSYAIS
jgi:AraC-like DNA-binding protein